MLFKQLVSGLVSISLAGLPFTSNLAFADANVAAGNLLGQSLQSGVSPVYDTSTGTIGVGGATVFTVQGASGDISAQKSAGDSKDALAAAVGTQLTALVGSGSKSGTAAGSAYQTIMQAQGSKRPDLTNDPLITGTEATIKSAINATGVSDCKTVTTVETTPDVQRTTRREYHCSSQTALSLSCTEGQVVQTVTPPSSLSADQCRGGDLLQYSYTCGLQDPPAVRIQISEAGENAHVQVDLADAGNYTGSMEFENCRADIRTTTTCEGGECHGDYSVDIYYKPAGIEQDFVYSGNLHLTPTFNLLQYGTSETSCTKFQSNAACTKISTKCISTLKDGTCLADDVVYECDETVTVPGGGKSKTEVMCPGAISCMGTSCGAKPNEVNDDFGKAASTLAALNNAAKEGADCDENGNCVIFKGHSSDCKKAMFGVVDCCNQPTGVSYLDYIRLSYASVELMDRFETTRNVLGQAKGLWNSATQPIKDTAATVWDSISTTASTAFNTIRDSIVSSNAAAASAESAVTGAVTNAKSIDSLSFFTGMKDKLTSSVVNWASSAFPGAGIVGPVGSDALFTATLDGAGNAVGNVALNVSNNMLASALSIVGTAYMIYTITTLIIQLIYSCTQDETKLAANRDLKLCHDVGSFCSQKVMGVCTERKESFCCYTSMLSRIMNEQVRGLLGLGFGTPEEPSCGGITTTQLASVDMSQMDLSEWMDSLKLAGIATDSATDAQLKYSSENMLKGVNPVTGTQQADPVAKAKALLGTDTNPSVVDDYRQQQQQAARKALEDGVKPPAP